MKVPSIAGRAATAVRSLSFAHLAGIGAAKSAEDEDDKEKKDAAAAAAAEDDKKDQDREDGDSKKSKAEGEEKDDKAEDDNKDKDASEGDDEDKKDAKASDDDDDEEMHGKSAAAQARRRERARCAAIMGSRYAANNVVLAASLAFNTTMKRSEALAVLRDAPAAASAQGRQSKNPQLGPGGAPAVNPTKAIESRWDSTMQKVRPTKK